MTTFGDHLTAVSQTPAPPDSHTGDCRCLPRGEGFRILNAKLAPSVPMIPAAQPDVRFLDIHGERIVFDANSLCAVRVDQATWDHLKSLGDNPSRSPSLPLSQSPSVHGLRGLLFSRDLPQFRLARSTPVRKVVLNVTHACNLACKYCFASERLSSPRKEGRASAPGHGDTENENGFLGDPEEAILRGSPWPSVVEMSLETAMAGVRMIEPGVPLDVAFFGGEPLLAWERVKEVVEQTRRLAAERHVAAKFHITTNATLLDAEKLAFLKEQPCSLLISLDGPAELHNAARPWRCGGAGPAPFEAVMKSLQRAADAGMSKRIMARSTFTLDNARLVERLEFFAGLQDAGLINGYSIEPAVMAESCASRTTKTHDFSRGGAESAETSTSSSILRASASPRELTSIAAEYHAAARWFVSRLRAGRSAGFFHFRKLLDRILHARHMGSECGAGKGYVTIAPDGTIHACHREGTAIGSVAGGFEETARAAWNDNRVSRRPDCMRCWARYLCGGGCRQARLELGGDLAAATPERCALQRTMIKECLWILTQVNPKMLRRL